MKNPLTNCVLLKTSLRFIQTALYSSKGHVLIGAYSILEYINFYFYYKNVY